MKLENQVCSLDLAKRLKELGVKQESYFWWARRDGTGGGDDWYFTVLPFEHHKDYELEQYAAFTVAELGEMLPADVHFFMGIKVKKRRTHAQHIHFFHGNGWMVNYTGGGARENYTKRADIEADARAKMLIYLIENKLLTDDAK